MSGPDMTTARLSTAGVLGGGSLRGATGSLMCKLRKQLASASDGKDCIETVRGRGYVLREPSEDEARIST